jgi:hypothetical protein
MTLERRVPTHLNRAGFLGPGGAGEIHHAGRDEPVACIGRRCDGARMAGTPQHEKDSELLRLKHLGRSQRQIASSLCVATGHRESSAPAREKPA